MAIECTHRWMSIAVYVVKLVAISSDIGFFSMGRGTKHRHDVELRAVAQRIVDDMVAGATPQHDAIARDIDLKLGHRNDSAECRIAGRSRFAVADQFGAEQRTKSVGCNQTLARKRAAILGRHHNAIATIFEAVHHGVGHKFNRITIPASIEQHFVQIDAVNDDVWVSEARPKRCSGRNSYQFPAVECIEHHHSRRRVRNGKDALRHAEAIEDVKNIGTELDAIADGAKFRRTFEHPRPIRSASKGESRCKPAETTTNYEDGLAHHRDDTITLWART